MEADEGKRVQVVDHGSTSWNDFLNRFNESKISYGVYRVLAIDNKNSSVPSKRLKLVFVTFMGTGVNQILRSRNLETKSTVRSLFHAHVEIDLNDKTLTEDEVAEKLTDSTGAFKPDAYEFGTGTDITTVAKAVTVNDTTNSSTIGNIDTSSNSNTILPKESESILSPSATVKIPPTISHTHSPTPFPNLAPIALPVSDSLTNMNTNDSELVTSPELRKNSPVVVPSASTGTTEKNNLKIVPEIIEEVEEDIGTTKTKDDNNNNIDIATAVFGEKKQGLSSSSSSSSFQLRTPESIGK